MIIKEPIKKSDGSLKYRNYIKKQKLGTGGFAQCYLVQRQQDKKMFALKIIPKKLLAKSKARQKMLSQIKIHKTSKHRHVCQLERAFEDQQNVYMILQLCKNRNMFELIKRRKRLTIPETQYFIYQLIDALCYLHKHQIIHRDVKLGNLLINENMQLKLADFGLASKIQFPGDRKHTVCGTPNYIAPQVIRSSMGMGHSGHSYEVDIWSTGVIMYIMLIGKAPFQTLKVQRTYQRISKGQFSFPQNFKDENAKDLLRKILVVDISKRYTFDQILAHPFMNPKQGIPKQLPPISMTSAPKFGIFQKYAQDQVKQSARQASIQTIRSFVQKSMDQDFGEQLSGNISLSFADRSKDNNSLTQRNDNKTERSSSKSKQVKGLLRSVLSTSSLHKSLQKLNSLGRCSSPQVRSIKGLEGNSMIQSSTSNTSRGKFPISAFNQGRMNMTTSDQVSDIPSKVQISNIGMFQGSQVNQMGNISSLGPQRISSISINGSSNQVNSHIHQHIQIQKKNLGPVYILSYRKQIIWSYILSNGCIGTYETNNHYKLIFNKHDQIYFQVINEGAVKKVKAENASLNENINNRIKFLEYYKGSDIYCYPYSNEHKLIYLRKVFEVKPESLILFKFSNEDIQAFNYQTNMSLIVTNEELTLVEVHNGKQNSRISVKKDKYADCPSKILISMYLKVKKILFKIHNAGKG